MNKQKCMQRRSYGSHSPTVCFRQIIGIDAARFHGLLKKNNNLEICYCPDDKDTATAKAIQINVAPPDVNPTFMLIVEVP